MTRLLQRARDFAYWRARYGCLWLRERARDARGARTNRRFERKGPFAVDPRIVYPCYKSLDEFVDVDRLRSLDGFLRDKVSSFLGSGKGRAFTTGNLKMSFLSRTVPGSTLIELTEAERKFQYLDLDEAESWHPSEHAAEFGPLMEFIDTLPFEKTARIIVMCDDRGRRVTAHRDHPWINALHEFIWFRSNLDKPFYVQDAQKKRKMHFRSHTAWFDTVNQYHGADETDRLSISMRVDGSFTEEFRALIPKPATNPASTPSLWASLTDQAS